MREFRRENLYWKINQTGESYTTEHGMVGTQNPQFFSDTPGSKGKPNTKAFVSAEDNCAFHVSREIRKKLESGYQEVIDGKIPEKSNSTIDFSKSLPKNFCTYKPQTSIEDKKHSQLFVAKKARYSRKRDGMASIACRHDWGWEIYTRRMDNTTERFPNHIAELNKLSFPVGTILVGEMLCTAAGYSDKDDFKAISRFYRSDPPVSRELVEKGEVVEPYYMIFDIIFHDGKSLADTTYDNRQKIIENALIESSLIKKVELYDLTPSTWEVKAKENAWEGFVIVDGSCKPGAKMYSFDGDAKRPTGHHKLKPTFTEEVIAYAGVLGNGKRLGKVGALLVAQKHPETGELFRCGKVGSGFTDEDIDALGEILKLSGLPIYDDEKKDKGKLEVNGVVVELEYSERQPGTNKFRFPVFMRVRTDKTPEECFAQRLSAEDE